MTHSIDISEDPDNPGTSHLDVRTMQESGGEPYSIIIDAVHQLNEDETLVLHSLFKPVPMLKQLARMGYNALEKQLDEEHWQVEIRRPDNSSQL